MNLLSSHWSTNEPLHPEVVDKLCNVAVRQHLAGYSLCEELYRLVYSCSGFSNFEILNEGFKMLKLVFCFILNPADWRVFCWESDEDIYPWWKMPHFTPKYFWASTKRKGLFTGLLQPPIGRCGWLIVFVGASLFIVHRVLCQTLTCLLLFSSRAAYDISFYTSDYDNESYMEIASRLHPQYLLLPQVPGDEFPMYFQEMIGGDFPAAIFCSTW